MVVIAEILAWAWLALLLVGQPVAAFRTRGRLQAERPPRLALYRGTALGIAAMGGVSFVLDLLTGRGASLALARPLGRGRLLAWCAATALACALYWAGSMWARKRGGRGADPAVLHLLPRTAVETVAFAGVALLAGVGEEMAFRGFAFFQVIDLTGSLVVAGSCVTVAFGLGHAYQGAAGVLRSTLVGALLLVPLLATGSLIPSMVGHAAVDLLTCFWMLPLLRRWGLDDPDGTVPAAG